MRERVSAERAVAVYAAMQAAFYVDDGSSLYRETAPAGGNRYAYLWPFSRALIGTLALAGIDSDLCTGLDCLSAVKDRVIGLSRYWDGRVRIPAYDSYAVAPYGGGGDKYHDDNAWLSLALVQLYRMGFTSDLTRAAQLFAFAQHGWDTNPYDPCPGGIFWVQQRVGFGLSNHDRGAGATAGAAELGFHLHELNGSDTYEAATTMLNWVSRYLDSSGTGSGPFWNVVREDGSIDTNVWSYNQGVMIGARVVQYRLSGSQLYLSQAEAIARATLETFGDFTRHPPSFNVMCFQNMLMLHAASADSSLKSSMLQTMWRYADWTWDPTSGARDPATNLFYFTDAGRPARGRQPARVQDQGAMLQLHALLAWDPVDYDKLT